MVEFVSTVLMCALPLGLVLEGDRVFKLGLDLIFFPTLMWQHQYTDILNKQPLK